MEWISVETVLPDVDRQVLILADVNGVPEMSVGSVDVDSDSGTDWRIGNSSLIWDYDYNDDSIDIEVTHWMPLPAAPATNNEKG